jgi:predicted dehydrogenase
MRQFATLGNASDTFLGAGLQTARRLIEEGRIGTPISAKATFGYPGPDASHPSPEFLFQNGGGPLLDMGPYYLTALVQLLGPVKTVGFQQSGPRQARYRQRPTRRRDLRRIRRHPGLGSAEVCIRSGCQTLFTLNPNCFHLDFEVPTPPINHENIR